MISCTCGLEARIDVIASHGGDVTLQPPVNLVRVVLPLERTKIRQIIRTGRNDAANFPSKRSVTIFVELPAHPRPAFVLSPLVGGMPGDYSALPPNCLHRFFRECHRHPSLTVNAYFKFRRSQIPASILAAQLGSTHNSDLGEWPFSMKIHGLYSDNPPFLVKYRTRLRNRVWLGRLHRDAFHGQCAQDEQGIRIVILRLLLKSNVQDLVGTSTGSGDFLPGNNHD